MVALVWLAVTGWLAMPGIVAAIRLPGTVVVVHWANGHMAGDDALLPTLADLFNAAGYRTPDGNRIIVRPRLVNSGSINRELMSRIRGTGRIARDLPDPTLVTPVAEHWLHGLNDAMGRSVVDAGANNSIATTWIGIATFKKMAECLGWPNRELGYADIIALSADPAGWSAYPCARAEWGRRPVIAYTDPHSSSTGRSVLFTLLSIATGRPPREFTAEAVADPRTIAYLRAFQAQVDHYVPDTLLLNCEIFGGPTYGHFFPLAEDNLVKLHKGIIVQTDPALERLFPCRRATGRPIEHDMVMIYPREGAPAHTHPAAEVLADWVTGEQRAAGRIWLAYLRADPQQQTFMGQGFRPSTQLAVACPICPAFGVQTDPPKSRIDLGLMPASVGEQAVAAWGDVKNTGVVVFVVDTSLAMAGDKLRSAREGVTAAIDEMYDRNSVGLVTFASTVHQAVAVGAVPGNRFALTDALRTARPSKGSDLFGAIATAVEMAANAPVAGRAIRGVVVLVGGPATDGAQLSDVVKMAALDGREIRACRGFGGDTVCTDESGRPVAMNDVRGVRLARDGSSAIKVYFLGIGMSDADLEVGRIFAEATGSNLVGTTSENLSRVVGVFKGYF
jgi:Ca-activated chloride channel family protein